jgi:hypothetical protein
LLSELRGQVHLEHPFYRLGIINTNQELGTGMFQVWFYSAVLGIFSFEKRQGVGTTNLLLNCFSAKANILKALLHVILNMCSFFGFGCLYQDQVFEYILDKYTDGYTADFT